MLLFFLSILLPIRRDAAGLIQSRLLQRVGEQSQI
jgi:hypothetical protein